MILIRFLSIPKTNMQTISRKSTTEDERVRNEDGTLRVHPKLVDEAENVSSVFADDPASLKAASNTLNAILSAPELAPLTKDEILRVLMSIQDFHGRAYDWHPAVSPEAIYAATESGGYLLRTKIRAAIEFFDQLFQYGEAGKTKITELGKETFEEDDIPELPDLDDL